MEMEVVSVSHLSLVVEQQTTAQSDKEQKEGKDHPHNGRWEKPKIRKN